MQSTFEEGKYSENSQLDVKTPMGGLNMNVVSTTFKSETSGFELPTSVMKITAEELEQLIADKMGVDTSNGLKAVIKLDGAYIKLADLEEGQIPLKVEDGKYILHRRCREIVCIKLED